MGRDIQARLQRKHGDGERSEAKNQEEVDGGERKVQQNERKG